MSRVVVVTGGAGAIGRSIATAFLQQDVQVLLVDLADDVFSEATRLGVAACQADITTEAGLTAVSSMIEGPVHCLVNNAGINRDARARNMTDESFRAVIDVDLVAPAKLAHRLKDSLTGGSVVNVSSRAALGSFGQCNYVAAKAGLIGLTRSLALRWAPDVRVNAVAPGLVDTPMTAAMPGEVLSKLVGAVPLDRIGSPTDVAEATVFLASNAASYITGQVILACGGRSIAA